MSKTVHSTVAFQTPLTTVVANGKLVLDLSQNATITASGGQVAPKRVSITLDSTGNAPNTTMLANDELTPSGTTYLASLYDSSGNFLGILGKWSIVGASPIDLSQIVATTTGASYPGVVLLNPAGQQNINGQTLNLEGASLSASAAASTTADTFLSRLAAGIYGIGTAIGNALGTIRAKIHQIGSASTGLSEDSAGVIDVGNGTQGDKSGIVLLSKLAAGGTQASGSVAGDITAGRSSTSGACYLGSDGVGFIFRNGATVQVQGTGPLTWTFPAASGTLTTGIPNKQIFTGNGTFTIPTGITAVKVTVTGGGGAGGGGNGANAGGGGGGAGGAAIKWLSGITPGNTIAVTVGAGGTGNVNAAGNNGGNSTIASGTQTITTVTGGGGSGGAGGNAGANSGGAGGTATNGDLNFGGNAGQITWNATAAVGSVGGGSIFGGGVIQGGNAGTAAGAGGSGTAANAAGGAGANGIVIFEWLN